MEQVTLVVNFDLPVDLSGHADNDTYLHRIGRSGRFGKRGFAVNLVDSQRSMGIIRQIESHFGEFRPTRVQRWRFERGCVSRQENQETGHGRAGRPGRAGLRTTAPFVFEEPLS